MLPTNPQSLTAADRSVLESLKQQGEQIDRQSKVLETLVDRVTRQMRSDEKLEKSDQKQKNQFKGDTKVNAIPGMAFDKISDKFNDFIVNRFGSIKDKFKAEKSKPVEKQESAKKEKATGDSKIPVEFWRVLSDAKCTESLFHEIVVKVWESGECDEDWLSND
jgi:hypothetical protein